MKKSVWVYGLIMGFVLSAFTVISVGMCYQSSDFGGNEVLGYSVMLVVFSLVFVAIRNHRNNFREGTISFGEAFKMGLSIVLIASTLYVVTWLVYYKFFIPDFMDRYADYSLRTAKENGATPEQLATQTKDMQGFIEMYKNPLFTILMSYAEIVPVGLVVSLLSALILKKKKIAA
ncbi:MAG: DUF4199 domain-containing protein [Saprospiraceae bacterium]|nr:DUF4199 domain-containing protein [Saprospiraceae bacterium]